MQIARKIIQTQPERLRDIKTMKTELTRLRKTDTMPEKPERISDVVSGSDGKKQALTREEAIKALQNHIKELRRYADIVDRALDLACSDITDQQTQERVRDCLILTFGETKQIPFYLLDYPLELTERDFEVRKRICLKYILRAIGLMPYQSQPAFLSPARKKNRPDNSRKART